MLGQLSARELQNVAELRRVKLVATLVLVGCFVALVIAKLLEARWPAMSFVASFAEAATIGGIADWYAVVALFKRPLNLPFPHTAIIPRNQERIGDNLGRFIEGNFLAPESVEKGLREVDFASLMTEWLSDPRKSEGLARFAVKLVPQMLSAVEESGLKQFAARRITTQVERVDIVPLAARLLESFLRDDRRHKLMDEIVSALHRFLNDQNALKSIQEKVSEELPTVFNLVRADALIVGRLVKATNALLEEVKDDPDHPLRGEFEQFFRNYVNRMKRSRKFARRVERFKRDILERPELANMADQLWNGLMTLIVEDAKSPDSVMVRRLTDMLVDVGRKLDGEALLKRDINDGMVMAVSSFVVSQKRGVSEFIAGPGQGLGFCPAHAADRGEYRQGPAIYPVQRDDHRRLRRARSAHDRTGDRPDLISANRSDMIIVLLSDTGRQNGRQVP